jgi:hypothetical protein
VVLVPFFFFCLLFSFGVDIDRSEAKVCGSESYRYGQGRGGERSDIDWPSSLT